MTAKEFVRRAMAHARELAEGLSTSEYDTCLEQLSFEIDEERMHLLDV